MRYFFHIIGVSSTFRDTRGQHFSTINEAKVHAAVVAGELGADGGAYRGFAVCLVNDQGVEMARLPVPGNPS
jgi:hypothetical protein